MQSERRQEDQEREKARRRQEERQLDKELQDSFPASDPPAIVQPTPSPEQDDKHKGDKTRRHART